MAKIDKKIVLPEFAAPPKTPKKGELYTSEGVRSVISGWVKTCSLVAKSLWYETMSLALRPFNKEASQFYLVKSRHEDMMRWLPKTGQGILLVILC
jgi:hypothetical protein